MNIIECDKCFRFQKCMEYENENKHKIDKRGVWIDGAVSPTRKCVYGICEKYLSALSNLKVLEVGCGTERKGGFVRDEVVKNSCEWTGIDQVETDLTTCVCKVEKMPFDDCGFDCIIGSETIEHWEDVDAALTEIRRVLKDDGRVYLTAPIHLHGRSEFVEGNFDVIERNFGRNGFSIILSEVWRSKYRPLLKYFPDLARSNVKKRGKLVDDSTCTYMYFCILRKF